MSHAELHDERRPGNWWFRGRQRDEYDGQRISTDRCRPNRDGGRDLHGRLGGLQPVAVSADARGLFYPINGTDNLTVLRQCRITIKHSADDGRRGIAFWRGRAGKLGRILHSGSGSGCPGEATNHAASRNVCGSLRPSASANGSPMRVSASSTRLAHSRLPAVQVIPAILLSSL